MSAQYQFTNNAATTLASSILIGATSLTVAAGTGALFPTLTGTQFFMCTLQNTAGTTIEIVKVTARSTDTFTIVRAQEGTSASAFASGDKCELRLTAGEINNLFSGIVQGGGSDHAFVENDATVTTSYTITTGRNAFSVGPVTVGSGAVVTVPSGQRWLVL
jgi:hypothetical protein